MTINNEETMEDGITTAVMLASEYGRRASGICRLLKNPISLFTHDEDQMSRQASIDRNQEMQISGKAAMKHPGLRKSSLNKCF